ncbi:DNA repair protein RecN [candidate division WOR-3 bacterium]|nr:DNA repair protein RecN [candidate division WOR-3 bacterium]
MLKLLNVKNFALMEDLTIDFESGLTVVTGETGAGKSMIIEAIATLCGSRLEDVLIRTNKDFAEVSGVLAVTPAMIRTLKDSGIECASDMIVRRKIERGKRQTTYINDHLISLNLLKELIGGSIDLIGQYENQSLFFARNHRVLLDTYAGLDESLSRYAQLYGDYRTLMERLEHLREAVRMKDDRIDYLTYQVQEIEKADVRSGEQENLEQERQLLATSEKRAQLSGMIIDFMYEQESSVIEQVARIKDLFDELSTHDPAMTPHCKELDTIATSIDELHREVSTYRNAIDFSKERLDEVQARLETIRSLQKKYGQTREEMMHYYDRIKEELNDLQARDEQIKTAKMKIHDLEKNLNFEAGTISAQRDRSARSLQKAILAKLAHLGMKKARFEIRITPCPINEHGKDEVEFFISTNPGEDPKPLRKVASGGEISRITLSMKTIFSEADRIPTVIFDEVDTGIGGSVAEAVGNLLAELSKQHQVICVTHLPQISIFADNHILVRKEIKGKETFMHVAKLDDDMRKQEIARMLGGKDITQKTIEHAAEFLKKGQAR